MYWQIMHGRGMVQVFEGSQTAVFLLLFSNGSGDRNPQTKFNLTL